MFCKPSCPQVVFRTSLWWISVCRAHLSQSRPAAAAVFPAGKGSWQCGQVDLGGPLFCWLCCSNGVLKFIDAMGKMTRFFPFSLFLGALPRLYQACYGILKVPEGSWLCRTCALGVQPKCLLCPKRGGALKPTRSGTKWVHVSCALWIPEVGRHGGGQPWGSGCAWNSELR